MSSLFLFLQISFISNLFSQKESFDYNDRTCNSHDCFKDVIKSFGNCKLSQDKSLCFGDEGCKFIGNSNIRLCIDPSIISRQTIEDLSKMVLTSSVSIGSQQLCLYDDNNNVYDELCKKAGDINSYCDKSSKKCVMTYEEYNKLDTIFEDDIKKHNKLSYKLPYDYSNNILLVVDGTETKKQFEYFGDNAIKGGNYKMSSKARWSNGNWASHASNFYEDYRGVKYYWYGADNSLKSVAAGNEVHELVEGVVDVICEFISNTTDKSSKYKLSDINIDVIGYSRGGYAIMEVGRKLDRDGCPGEFFKSPIQIRFMGLYDPVSSIFKCDGIFNCHGHIMDGGISDTGLYSNDDYHYDANVMPTNVDKIVISYGDPILGSRAYYNTAENKKNNDERNEIIYNKFITTHGGIGGFPLVGDYNTIKNLIQNDGWKGLFGLNRWLYSIFIDGIGDVDNYGPKMECNESMNADLFIRSKANQYGLPIDSTDKDYYHFFGCDGYI